MSRRRVLGGWAELTSDLFGAHTYPGGHFSLDKHATAMVGVMRRSLAAQQTTSS